MRGVARYPLPPPIASNLLPTYMASNKSMSQPLVRPKIEVPVTISSLFWNDLLREHETLKQIDTPAKNNMQLDSVVRKRRKKMKKHKLRKRRKREKAEKRKLSQGR